MTHHDHNERWNRICHSNALREMQLAPAETHQLPLHGATLSWRSYVAFGVMCFVLTVIWSAN